MREANFFSWLQGLVSSFGKFQASAVALILANFVPLFGVLVLGWNAASIVVLYWAENLIIGCFNVLRMERARGPLGPTRLTLNGRPVTEASRSAVVQFFVVHYGLFTVVHGVFVWTFFGARFSGSLRDLGLATLGLACSHGISYRRNFIGQGESLKVSFAALFWQPYSRVIVMHLTTLLGGVLAQAMDSPVPALISLVLLKTAVDLLAHLSEQRKFLRTGQSLSAV
jgi:hypothetical protein